MTLYPKSLQEVCIKNCLAIYVDRTLKIRLVQNMNYYYFYIRKPKLSFINNVFSVNK